MSDSEQESNEPWLEADTEASDADPEAAAAVLEAIAETLRDAPDGQRYDIQLEVNEHER